MSESWAELVIAELPGVVSDYAQAERERGCENSAEYYDELAAYLESCRTVQRVVDEFVSAKLVVSKVTEMLFEASRLAHENS